MKNKWKYLCRGLIGGSLLSLAVAADECYDNFMLSNRYNPVTQLSKDREELSDRRSKIAGVCFQPMSDRKPIEYADVVKTPEF